MNKAMATISRGQCEAGKVYSYDAQGRVTQLRETNFVFEKTTTILYNDHGDAVEVYTTVADNAVVPAGVSYSFDEEGNLTPSETPSAAPERLPLPPPEESPLQLPIRQLWQLVAADHDSRPWPGYSSRGAPPNTHLLLIPHWARCRSHPTGH